jgi:CRISPR-associated protein Cmr2
MSRWLIAVSIGPVQEFIAAARRTRDLWFGSYLLSELAKAAAASALEMGAELVFPCPPNPTNDLAPHSAFRAPNKLLLVHSGGAGPGQSVSQMEAVLRKTLARQAESARDNAKNDGKVKTINVELMDRQLAGLLEFYAAWTPFPRDEDYEAARERVESLLSARKALRNFSFYKGSNVPKSTIDGIRETVVSDRGPEFVNDFETPAGVI